MQVIAHSGQTGPLSENQGHQTTTFSLSQFFINNLHQTTTSVIHVASLRLWHDSRHHYVLWWQRHLEWRLVAVDGGRGCHGHWWRARVEVGRWYVGWVARGVLHHHMHRCHGGLLLHVLVVAVVPTTTSNRASHHSVRGQRHDTTTAGPRPPLLAAATTTTRGGGGRCRLRHM